MKKLIIILIVLAVIAAGIWYWRKYQRKNRIVRPEEPENGDQPEKKEKEKVISPKKAGTSYNPVVEQMQKSINNVLKINAQKLIAVDGIYGPETESGLRKALAYKGTTPEKVMFALNQGKSVEMNFTAVFDKIEGFVKSLS
jgi:hypothetical protein